MLTVYTEKDHAMCQSLWQEMVPPDKFTDLWEVRYCFHRHYQRDLFFVVAKDGEDVVGLIPLSWIAEEGYWGYFPAEIWAGQTWLEQNRLIARDAAVLSEMLAWLDQQGSPYRLRYLVDSPFLPQSEQTVDEIGYLFHPPQYEYEMSRYHAAFSRRSLKSIKRDIQRFLDRGVTYRHDDLDDFDLMVNMNLQRFAEGSYFADARFTAAFRELMGYLHEQGWLRMTTILVDGIPAAVDMGVLYRNIYTLVAGGTHADYPGIAKLINFHHMEKACEERFEEVDFLCGNFSWKTLFHLTPRPLYHLPHRTADQKEIH